MSARHLPGESAPPPGGEAPRARTAVHCGGRSSVDVVAGEPVPVRDLLRWSETLAALARTGIGFTASTFERERYEEILAVAGEISAEAQQRLADGGHRPPAPAAAQLVQEWLAEVRPGVAGYVTPRLSVGAIVGNDAGEILLVQRRDSGVWLYPTGWADVGYSAAEVAAKEVAEETGIDVEPVRLVMVLDGLRLGFSRAPLYSLVFHCQTTGPTASVQPHLLECSAAGWFDRESLPVPLAGSERWVTHAFDAIDGKPVDVLFDRPRTPAWRRPEP
ncbi:MAG: ADP-ribose pyrophosphatase [Acidimicrobiaceae bacterium]|nr:ADP-ribose pyrophosphatase [Acidimicrobiaceae bacterium]